MRVGVVGCGYWGSKHVRVLRSLPDIKSLVVVDPQAERRTVIADAYPSITQCATLEEALDRVDALVVATPPSTHATIGRKAIEAGKHLLIEKPLATSTADAADLVSLADAADTILMVGHTFEHNAAVQKLRAIIEADDLGTLYYVDTARLNLGLYQPDINVLWDLAPHDVSIVNYLLDDTPTAVQAWGEAHAHPLLEDVAYLRLEYGRRGVTVQVHVSWLDPCKVRRVTVVGSEKMAVYNDLNDDQRIRVYDKGVVAGGLDETGLDAVPSSYRYGSIVAPYIDFGEPLLTQDRMFVDCVGTGAKPTTDGRNGLNVVRVLEAADTSLREGRRVDVRYPLRALS